MPSTAQCDREQSNQNRIRPSRMQTLTLQLTWHLHTQPHAQRATPPVVLCTQTTTAIPAAPSTPWLTDKETDKLKELGSYYNCWDKEHTVTKHNATKHFRPSNTTQQIATEPNPILIPAIASVPTYLIQLVRPSNSTTAI